MRHIPLETRAHFEGASAIPGEALEEVRNLSSRFPDAGLRTVAVLRAPSLDRKADPLGATQVWLAVESLQTTGSFKVRGALCALDAAKRKGIAWVVGASAGNHGAGLAHAARTLGMRTTIFVPSSTAKRKLDVMTQAGAEVVMIDGGYDTAEKHARLFASAQGVDFVSPYEGMEVCLGNGASLAFEIVEALGTVPEHALVPIGGGGLAAGMAWGLAWCLDEGSRSTRRVWTVQTESSPAFAMSVDRGAAVQELDPPATPTLAEGLEGGISDLSFQRARGLVAGVSVTTEDEVAYAMATARGRLQLRLEGSAAVALVPVLRGLPIEMCGGNLVVVLTGRNVDDEALSRVARCGSVRPRPLAEARR